MNNLNNFTLNHKRRQISYNAIPMTLLWANLKHVKFLFSWFKYSSYNVREVTTFPHYVILHIGKERLNNLSNHIKMAAMYQIFFAHLITLLEACSINSLCSSPFLNLSTENKLTWISSCLIFVFYASPSLFYLK